jgi:hypothetical protein
LRIRKKEGKRLLFLKKKKQKNFYPFGPDRRQRRGLCVETCKWTKVFLVLFFQKKNCLPFCRLPSLFPHSQADRVYQKKLSSVLASVWSEARQFAALERICGDREAMGDAALAHPTGAGVATGGRQVRKVFLVLFFQKKNCLPSCRLPSSSGA